jgi:hypothetical protein
MNVAAHVISNESNEYKEEQRDTFYDAASLPMEIQLLDADSNDDATVGHQSITIVVKL